MKTELLPCPFCGQPGKLSKASGNWNAYCISGDDVEGKMKPCGIVLFGNWDETKESVATRWNDREPPPSASAHGEVADGATEALQQIAKQKIRSEMTEHDPDDADWEGGYEGIVMIARDVLAAMQQEGGK